MQEKAAQTAWHSLTKVPHKVGDEASELIYFSVVNIADSSLCKSPVNYKIVCCCYCCQLFDWLGVAHSNQSQ